MGFLDDVLPTLVDSDEGFFASRAAYVAVGIQGRAVSQRMCRTKDELVAACMEFTKQGMNSYFAQAGFGDMRGGRTQANAQALRAFWLDVDVGKVANSYPDRETAVEAIVALSKKLPLTYLVSSGAGFYTYFCLREDIDPETWTNTARRLAVFVKSEGFIADPACTCDSARILRLPGTRHKSGATVKILWGPGRVWDFSEFAALLPESAPLAPKANAPMFDEAPFYKAERIVRNCPAVMSAGISLEPNWFAMMSVMRRCVDGREWAHKISATDPARYNPDATDRKFDRAPANAPATCATFERNDARWCADCAFRGMVKSPVQLARMTASTPVETPAPKLEPAERLSLPEEFEYPLVGLDTQKFTVSDKGVVYHAVEKDPAGNLRTVDHLITQSRIYYIKSTTERLSRTETARAHWFKAFKPNGRPGKTGAVFARDLASPASAYGTLASMDVVSSDFAAYGNAMFQKFLNTYVNAILANDSVNEIPVTDVMGWSDWKDEHGLRQPGFSIAGGLLTAEGLRPQDYSGLAMDFVKAMTPKGDLEAWKEIPRMYRELDQPLGQFCFCLGFGAVLMPWGSGAAKSATMSIWSPESGLGKTQLLRGVATIWGDPDDQFVKRDSSPVRRQKQLAVLHNLPAFMDELTDRSDEELYSLAYDLVSGQEKQKMSRNGRDAVDTGTWNTVTFLTSNRSIKEAVAHRMGDSDAAMVRVVEIECDFRSFAHMPDTQRMITDRVYACSEHHGVAGPEFLWQLLRRQDLLTALSPQIDHWVISHGFTNEERFMANPIAIALKAGRWAVDWGLLDYDMDRLEEWAMDVLVPVNRRTTSSLRADPAEILLDYLMLRQRNMLVVQSDTRKGPQPSPDARIDPYVVIGPSNNDVYLRLAIAEQRLYFSASDFKTWCEKRNFSPANIVKSLEGAGFSPRRMTRNLSLGTQRYSTPVVTCYMLEGKDLDKIGYDAESLKSAWTFRQDTMKAMP